MVSIKDRKILRQMFSHYDYVMTTAQLSKEKLYYRDIQRMLKAGLIEKVKRGYYHWTMGSGKGDVVIISRLFPDGILYMETALSALSARILRQLPLYALEKSKKIRCVLHGHYAECGRPFAEPHGKNNACQQRVYHYAQPSVHRPYRACQAP